MAKQYDDEIESSGRVNLAEYVTVAIAEDLELASEYADVLKNSEINAVTKAHRDQNSTVIGFAVMVSEEDVDEAYLLIESQQAFGDFLDLAFNPDGDEYNMDDEYFDDDF